MTPGTATACPGCRGAMQRLALEGHYDGVVDVDLCAACHLLWFDGTESVQLTGRGVLHLLRAVDTAHASAHMPLPKQLACPRCEQPLKHVHNRTTVSRTAQHECPRGHGAAQSFALYLGEKGFVRPLLRPEVARLQRTHQRAPLACINCGAPLDPSRVEACTFCASPVRVLDVLPLVRAIDRQTGHLQDAPATSPEAAARCFACVDCGAPVDPVVDRACRTCGMPVAVTDLRWALRWMEPLLAAVDAGRVAPGYRERRFAAVHRAAPVLPQQFMAEPYGGGSRPPLGIWIFAAVMMALVALVAWYGVR